MIKLCRNRLKNTEKSDIILIKFIYKKCSFDADTVTAVTLLLGRYQG